MGMKKYFLDSDGDGHKYIIPVERRKEWNDWLELTDSDEQFEILPDWVYQLGHHISHLEFHSPEIDGKLLFPRKIIAIDFSSCKNWDECMKWMEGQPDYRTDYDNWLKYWKDAGLIDEKQFI